MIMYQGAERTRKANPVCLGDILVPIVKGIGLDNNLRFQEIQENWESIVGTTNARNTTPHALKDGVLTVTVSSPVWMTQAHYYKASFLEKINTFDNRYGTIVRKIDLCLKDQRGRRK